MLFIIAFIAGACMGSFIGVCIDRISIGESIITPRRSYCPKCGKTIKFYHNIPIISYIILKGRCGYCFKPISLRYPLIELGAGLICLCTVFYMGFSVTALVSYVFILSLITASFIDIDHFIIPDIITISGIFVFFALSFVLPKGDPIDSLIGMITGGGILYIIDLCYKTAAKRTGIGAGDVKLCAMTGAFTGFKGAIFTIFVSSLIGSLIGLIIMLIKKENLKLAVPFGPFISIGAVIYIFFGANIIRWYFN